MSKVRLAEPAILVRLPLRFRPFVGDSSNDSLVLVRIRLLNVEYLGSKIADTFLTQHALSHGWPLCDVVKLTMVLTFRYRVKSLNGLLNKQARAVNYIWNYCNDVQKHALKWSSKWPSGFDLNRLTAGSSRELGLHSGAVSAVCEQYAKSRRQHKRPFLRFRGKKSLGWIPFKGRDIKVVSEDFRFNGHTFRVFMNRPLPDGKICDGSSFAQDARGNWFLNIVIEIADAPRRELHQGVGIDLGLKDFAALSTGEKIEAPCFYRQIEGRLAVAQRAGKKRQARNLHARIEARRCDFLHKLSSRLVRDFDFIAVGDVNASALMKTTMAKSVGDASWTTFRNFLRYKAIGRGAWYEEVSERFTTQVCSDCGAMPDSRPKGIADLGIRSWICTACGSVHDRDTNAARNILSRHGHVTQVAGASACHG